ncbi:hypothetical protein BpHYR1_032447 [Brachionus plicatilis]|uniref:Uncharacterized protein n=1 Tax=Brachionus plicatilis TaxID=10195 RepID=A0A3M7PJ11_BRAPC|nr:hypothetical protein BpHYR1_032447 [Brachionus plicatilis]
MQEQSDECIRGATMLISDLLLMLVAVQMYTVELLSRKLQIEMQKLFFYANFVYTNDTVICYLFNQGVDSELPNEKFIKPPLYLKDKKGIHVFNLKVFNFSSLTASMQSNISSKSLNEKVRMNRSRILLKKSLEAFNLSKKIKIERTIHCFH